MSPETQQEILKQLELLKEMILSAVPPTPDTFSSQTLTEFLRRKFQNDTFYVSYAYSTPTNDHYDVVWTGGPKQQEIEAVLLARIVSKYVDDKKTPRFSFSRVLD